MLLKTFVFWLDISLQVRLTDAKISRSGGLSRFSLQWLCPITRCSRATELFTVLTTVMVSAVVGFVRTHSVILQSQFGIKLVVAVDLFPERNPQTYEIIFLLKLIIILTQG